MVQYVVRTVECRINLLSVDIVCVWFTLCRYAEGKENLSSVSRESKKED